MSNLLRFAILLLGCFLVTMAFTPLIMWAVFSALVNFYPTVKVFLPPMSQLIGYNVLYSLELAFGLVCIRKALR